VIVRALLEEAATAHVELPEELLDAYTRRVATAVRRAERDFRSRRRVREAIQSLATDGAAPETGGFDVEWEVIGPIRLSTQDESGRARVPPTTDQALWVAVRNRAASINVHVDDAPRGPLWFGPWGYGRYGGRRWRRLRRWYG
jgi:hypothetical protein